MLPRATNKDHATVTENQNRLDRALLPIHYDLHLDLDLEAFTFHGEVAIRIHATRQTDRIVLNAADLDIDTVALTGPDGPVDIGSVALDDDERLTIALPTGLAAGESSLTIGYRGTINDQLRGLYRSTYTDAEGVEHPIATSQCQPADARRILPCWDEPDFKARFRTTLTVPEGTEAYTNTAETSRSTSGARTTIVFGTTMPMSTYLLAVVAGPFEASEPVVVRDTPIRVIVPRGRLPLAKTALRNATWSFEFLSDYFGIPYPGGKLDHIALPDFPSGAMENLGLVIYREPTLVLDPDTASQSELQTSMDVIAHETAHQWFGNLVTMSWSEGIWLNEAFANLMQFKTTDARYPEWKRWLGFASSEVPWAMLVDQLASTHPIEFPVTSLDEVNQMFDAITYGKGSAVLHMLDQFIGPEAFQIGVRAYLTAHLYGNTVTSELWEGLESATDWPVGRIASTWVYQPGFPQLEISRVPGGIRIIQRRYLVIPDENDATEWQIPMQLHGEKDGAAFSMDVLLTDRETMLPGEFAWVVGNTDGNGFYRARYDDELFASLLDHIGELSDIERYTLVSDALAQLRSGELDAAHLLDVVRLFTREREQAVWSVVTGVLANLSQHAVSPEARPAFEEFTRNLISAHLAELGDEPGEADSDLDRKLRGDLTVVGGVMGADPAIVARCRGLAARLLGGEAIDAELATAALAVFAHGADDTDYAALWHAYETATSPIERARYLRAIAAVADPRLATTTLDRILDRTIKSQDASWVFARLLATPAGPRVWEHAERNWDRLLTAMPGVTRSHIVDGIAMLSQAGTAEQVKAFLAEHPVEAAAHPLRQNLERLEANMRLRARESPVVDAYFARSADTHRLTPHDRPSTR